jgi:hypothetical protein
VTSTRLTILSIVRRAATQLAIHEVKQTLLQTIIDLTAQIYEKIHGDRQSINMTEVGGAAINGAIGGTVGFGSGLLGKLVSRNGAKLPGELLSGSSFGAIFDDLSGSGLNGAGKLMVKSVTLVGDAGWNSATGAAEAAAQDAALNGGHVTQDDSQAGALNGIGISLFGHAHDALNPAGHGIIDSGIHKISSLTRAPKEGTRDQPPGLPGFDGNFELPGIPAVSDTFGNETTAAINDILGPPTYTPQPHTEMAADPEQPQGPADSPPPGLPGLDGNFELPRIPTVSETLGNETLMSSAPTPAAASSTASVAANRPRSPTAAPGTTRMTPP